MMSGPVLRPSSGVVAGRTVTSKTSPHVAVISKIGSKLSAFEHRDDRRRAGADPVLADTPGALRVAPSRPSGQRAIALLRAQALPQFRIATCGSRPPASLAVAGKISGRQAGDSPQSA
jgi:hypothetical protein